MRNNEDFKAEILRRRQMILQKRKKNRYLFSSCAVALILCTATVLTFSSLGKNPSEPNGSNGEESVPVIYINLKDRTLFKEEDVTPRLEALAKYAPLPNEIADDMVSNSVDIWATTSTDCATETATGCPSPSWKQPVATFTVVVNGKSRTYYLRKKNITVNQKVYPLTDQQFEELFALFGDE